MTFFYDLNKKLDTIREKPETTHKQLNERDMSRAAKGYEKYGKEGMEALAKAGREGKSLDPIRAKYNKYKDSVEEASGDYSAKKARAGKDIGKPGKNFEKIAKGAAERYGSKAAGERVAGAVLNKLRHPKEGMEEGLGDAVKKVGGMAKKVGGAVLNKLGHGDDQAMRKDLQRKMGMPQTGKKPGVKEGDFGPMEGSAPMTPKQKSFAKLAPPTDKITFADKIAGAKKEVDEMLGDVAATAIKSAVGRKKVVADEGWDEMERDVKSRMGARRVGDVTHGAKHDTQEIPGGRRVTRRTDPNTGYSVGADSDEPASGEKRGRGRPKGPAKGPERVTAKATKHKGGRKTNEGDLDITDRGEYDQEGSMAKDDIHTIVRHARALEKILGDNDNLPEWVQAKLAKIEGMMTAVDDYMQDQRERDVEKSTGEEGVELDEKAVSKKQQRFMGMVHATQKGEKAPSKAVAKVAKEMPKKAAKDFASTKQKGLPEKAPKKKEKTEEQGGTGTPTASSGFSYGKGIYDSMNRELESMISESMNVSMSMNTDANGGPSRSITVTATDDDAMKLGELLKNAGLGGHDYPHIEGGADMDHPGAIEVNGTMDAEGAEQLADKIRQAMGDHEHAEGETCDACGQADCGCEEMDESYGDDVVDQNSPDFPTNTETSHDALQYSGGLNKPKASGMATIPVTDVVADGEDNFGKPARTNEDDLSRLREMAGIKEAKKDVEEEKTEEGNLFTGNLAKARADGKKEADLDGDGDMEKVRESILDLKHLWSQYKG